MNQPNDMYKLDKHFKCPKPLKTMLAGQSKHLCRQMYAAFQEEMNWKRRSATKRGGSDKE